MYSSFFLPCISEWRCSKRVRAGSWIHALFKPAMCLVVTETKRPLPFWQTSAIQAQSSKLRHCFHKCDFHWNEIFGMRKRCRKRHQQAGHIRLRGIPFYTNYLNVAGKYISKKNICTKFEVTRSPAIEYHALAVHALRDLWPLTAENYLFIYLFVIYLFMCYYAVWQHSTYTVCPGKMSPLNIFVLASENCP